MTLFKKVILMTTMRDKVSVSEGEQREKQLVKNTQILGLDGQ